ncbi:DUF1302 family protein [Nevskia soli]|uniref:DUF1302 family protein n=1 Tax=Nevskia soli TaxID=418856 RepID=UPI0012F77AAF|nr:DUF1302 family protein [Nevskia soli]
MKFKTVGTGALVAGMLLGFAPFADAQDNGSPIGTGWLSGVDFAFGQMLREETAYRTNPTGNPYNQNTNVFQDQTVARQAFLPPTLGVNLVKWGEVPLPYGDTVRRGDFVPTSGNRMNYEILRSETEFAVKFGEQFNITGRLRGIYQPDVYDDFNASSVGDQQQGGITGGIPSLYHGKPNYMGYEVEGKRNPNPLEWSGRNYQLYFPALFAEYHIGDLDVRAGNQQIAWGQEIYLRTFDVPNGLDFRRHLITDRALEEFSDKRIPQLSIRATDQLTDTMLIDGFVSKFQPTVYPNPNTPYNVIASQFTIHDLYSKNGYDSWNKLDYGIRLKDEHGQWGWQAAFVRRFNPDGAFRWTESGVVKSFNPAPLSLGSVVNTLYALKLPGCTNPTLCRQYANTGEAFSHTPFEVAPAGIYTFDEWKKYGELDRLTAIGTWNAAVKDFPALADVYQTPVETMDELKAELNTDFIVSGGSLRGHIARDYFQENLFMLGGTYTIESENNFLNEMIFNLEGQYTPHRVFTAADLNVNFQQEDEYTITATMDKWHRFWESIPATYLVLEVETKNRSDLTGRVLKGYGVSTDRDTPGKRSNATYVVFGFSQPFPNKVYELEFATLIDTGGGLLAQPTGRWHPSGHITVEAFYNYVNGHLYNGEGNNLFSSYGYTNDVNLRLTYKF